MTLPPISYRRHRFPPAIIAHAAWLYFRFPLSLRLVEEMLLERGIAVSYETVRRWARKFGRDYARRIRRKKPGLRDIWHLDEVVVTVAGKKHWLWRAVDQDGYILDEIVQTRRDTKAARRLLRRLLKKQGCAPRRMITDKLAPMPRLAARSCRRSSISRTRASTTENSHLPLRKRERAMQGFRSPGGLQRFVAVFSAVRNLFVPPRSRRWPSPPICIVWTPWRTGKPSPASPPEPATRPNAPLGDRRQLT
jgi:putative transposase